MSTTAQGGGPFSRRFGLETPAAQITARYEAPDDLRHAVLLLARRAGLGWDNIVRILSEVLLVAPKGNWSDDWLENEARGLVRNAPWQKVYDVAEAIYEWLADPTKPPYVSEPRHGWFERELTAFFQERGIGWRMVSGKIQLRGEDPVAEIVQHAVDTLANAGRHTAANELQEAWRDLSRRPEPDATGAIQHALAGLECAVRDFTGQPNSTLGKLVADNPTLFPKPLDGAVEKLWGYTSQYGRHIKEGQKPGLAEAVLVVGLAVSVASFLDERTRNHT